jgi:beta-galactosidase
MPLVVMTNCDEVGLVMGSVDKGRFKPDFLKWAGLRHPPVVIKADEGAWGMAWQDAAFTGYVGGKAVIEKRFAADSVPVALELKPDSSELRAQGPGDAWDATRVVLRLVDRCGNHMPFAFEPVKVTIEGPGVLVGPSEFSLMGGVSAIWVRATDAGSIKVSARTPGMESETIAIKAE